jgi:hypothetical protein
MSTLEGMVLNREINRHRAEGVLHLVVDARPAFRPARWAWYAVDYWSGEVVEYAFEYDSNLAARRAGLERLAELASCLARTTGGTVATWRLKSVSDAWARSSLVSCWPGRCLCR